MLSHLDKTSHSFFKELTEGPFLLIASYLEAQELCQIDAACIRFKVLSDELNLWRNLGTTVYAGIALEREGTFENLTSWSWKSFSCCRYGDGFNVWKQRYGQFKREIFEFRFPFQGTGITEVRNRADTVYCSLICRCKLAYDQTALANVSTTGVYFEVEVLANHHDISLMVVDFDQGEKSRVIFRPHIGVVVWEELQNSDGTYMYIKAMHSKRPCFTGKMGVYVQNGNIAFFRKYEKRENDNEEPCWGTTGFIMDAHPWAEGRKLTPCLAFEDEGSFEDAHVRVVQINSHPPFLPQKNRGAYNSRNWTVLR